MSTCGVDVEMNKKKGEVITQARYGNVLTVCIVVVVVGCTGRIDNGKRKVIKFRHGE